MISFNCHTCHEPLQVPESLAGDKLTCPKCSTELWVPRPKKASAQSSSQPANTTKRLGPERLQPPAWPKELELTPAVALVLGFISVVCVIGGLVAIANDVPVGGVVATLIGAIVLMGCWLAYLLVSVRYRQDLQRYQDYMLHRELHPAPGSAERKDAADTKEGAKTDAGWFSPT